MYICFKMYKEELEEKSFIFFTKFWELLKFFSIEKKKFE